mmetsp:Transcript_8669/g.23839  ORF Transcript_8669/g.23839 Transcript_8669/m.23839 type:complete len:359 (-) Transcript_8669:39-1115(-)
MDEPQGHALEMMRTSTRLRASLSHAAATSSVRGSVPRLVFATHNTMDGLLLPLLLDNYARLTDDAEDRGARLATVCLQENRPGHAERVATTLGRGYRAYVHPIAPRLATIYDADLLRLEGVKEVSLPRLGAVPLWQRLYVAKYLPERKYATLLRFKRFADGAPILLANFHLDAAGTNAHRAEQLAAVSEAMRVAMLLEPSAAAVACGDTNVFSFQRARASAALTSMLRQLHRDCGMVDVAAAADRDTHFFRRANEPKLGQRIAVFFGHLGVDFPCRYDVVCTSLPLVCEGQVETPDSDHDLVWAEVEWPLKLSCGDDNPAATTDGPTITLPGSGGAQAMIGVDLVRGRERALTARVMR